MVYTKKRTTKYGKKRKLYRKKRNFRRTKMRGAKQVIMRGPSGFPDRIRVKLRYADVFTVTQTTGIAGQQCFRGNSLYDPDFTGTGHQPYGYDQWSAFYGNYRVHGSSITVRATPISQSAGFASIAAVPVWMVVVPSLSSTFPGYSSPIEEMPYSSCKMFNISSAGSKGTVMNKYMSTAKIWGDRISTVKNEDNFQAPNNNNPANVWYWLVKIGSLDGLSSTITYEVSFQLTYYAEFFGRINMGQS